MTIKKLYEDTYLKFKTIYSILRYPSSHWFFCQLKEDEYTELIKYDLHLKDNINLKINVKSHRIHNYFLFKILYLVVEANGGVDSLILKKAEFEADVDEINNKI